MRKVVIYILFSIQTFVLLQSQDISGKWTGIIKSKGSDLADEMYFEFHLEQKGERVSGYSFIYFSENYGKAVLEGWIHDSVFEFKELEVVDSKLIHGYQWCLAKGELKMTCKNGIAILQGNYSSELYMSHPCKGGSMKVKHEKPCGTCIPVNQSEITVIDSSGVVKTMLGREVKDGHHVSIKRPILTIKIADNQEVDNDVVSLLYNGDMLLEKYPLKKRAKVIEVEIDLEQNLNYITFHAVNMGERPPNTAVIIIDDGIKKHKIQIESDLERSDIIYLDYEP